MSYLDLIRRYYCSMVKVCICGTVRNCAPYLDRVFTNIEAIGSSCFDNDYVVILFYDPSTDNTLAKLAEWKKKNARVSYYVNPRLVSSYRTHRLAYARNFCLQKIRVLYSDAPYFIMMDMDDVNCKRVTPEVLKNALSEQECNKWDALSFNTVPRYYDIWGLSIAPFCGSYNHFNDNYAFHGKIGAYIDLLLKKCVSKGVDYLPCFSSFNGFSIYKTDVFIKCIYDGRPRFDLIGPRLMNMHSKAAKSPVVYKRYGNGHIDGAHEDCEHRAFHYQAIRAKNARIMISPLCLFR